VDKLKLLVAQTCSVDNHEGNIETLNQLAMQAAEQECDMLCLPEVSGLVNQHYDQLKKIIQKDDADPYVAACKQLAKQHSIWIHNGSTPILGELDMPVNRTHLINTQGELVAHYDKIHLFDVYLPDGRERLESKRYAAGNQSVLADTPWGLFGLTICYDLRFPHLYRDYALKGARLMFVPSAFNRRTGAAHWEVLLRARAIENGCFIVAAAQTGEHADGRKTYGHSLVVNPWGDVVMDLNTTIQAKVIELDLSESDKTRQQIPSLLHTRNYE